MWNRPRDCPDCGVPPGSDHERGCDVEPCPNCGCQRISCDCDLEVVASMRPVPWSGIWPGIAECRKYGLYAKRAQGPGWVPCGPDEPGASEDMNRLIMEGRWNKEKQVFDMDTETERK